MVATGDVRAEVRSSIELHAYVVDGTTAASLVAMAVTLVVGLIAAGVMLPLTSAHAAALT